MATKQETIRALARSIAGGGIVGAAVVAIGVLLATHVSTWADEKVKVGFVYVGPIGDFGWSFQHNQGRLAVTKALGDKVETNFVESVPEGADAERVINQLAAGGDRLIFTTSFGYMNPTIKVASQFPNVKFEHATGYKRAPNVATYAARFYEGRYVVGLIAGKMTKSNIIGYIGSVPIPEVVSGIDSFTQGLHKVNPTAEVRVVYVNSWYDPGKEAAATKALIDEGADVILQHTDSPAPVQTAEDRGKWAVGQSSDMAKFGPHAQLTAIVDHWDDYYVQRTKDLLAGTWKPTDTWGGLNTGMVQLAPYNPALPADVVALAEDARKAIAAGTLKPFQGPIKDQSGKLIVPDGKALADPDILSMNYYIQGVQGTLPK